MNSFLKYVIVSIIGLGVMTLSIFLLMLTSIPAILVGGAILSIGIASFNNSLL